jgi:hypothetical protein
MSRPIVRSLARFAVVASVLALLPACTKSVVVTSPGAGPATYPWKACGQDCVSAFAELEETHDPTGKDCEALVGDAVDMSGDERVVAAALYDSALLLVLRGKGDEALGRLAKAEALDHDPEYRALEQRLRLELHLQDSAPPDSPARYWTPPSAPPAAPSADRAPAPITPTTPAAAVSVAAPAAAPPAPPASSTPAPASSALLTPH